MIEKIYDGGMKIRRRDKRVWFVGLGMFVAVFLFTFLGGYFETEKKDAEAASLANFDAGYIISDYQMGNYTAMSENEIQAFLTAKNSCSNIDGALYNRMVTLYSGYSWHFENGHFVCLSEELFGDGETIGTGETAAHIIWQAAQDYRINPQVLIVLLQKEQGLITDTYPNNRQYRSATGYGCPDTAPCAEQYYGFKNQVRKAAALFRTVLDGGWTNYPLGENYIQYNPSASCGGSVVNIRSLATSALYRYTPYQPNAGALAAGYGTAYCGAYGNRNFYLYFEDWFGGITNEESIEEQKEPTRELIMEENSNSGKESSDLNFSYKAKVQNFGWLDSVSGGEITGSSGYGLQMEAISINLEGVEYRSHLATLGWESEYKKNGEESGNTEEGLRVEALQIKLNEELSRRYDVFYRAHVENIGWMDWVQNGEVAGTTGRGLRLEAIQIKIVRKEMVFQYRVHVENIGWMDWVQNGEVAGTTGRGLQIEAIEMID